MVAKSKQTARSKATALPPQETIEELDEESGEEFSDLTAFLGEMQDSSTAQVSVYRDVKGRASGTYLFRCTPSEFSLADVMDKLRDEYDGGIFRICVYANGARLKNQLIQVEAPKKSAFDFLQKPVPPVQPQNDLAGALLQIQESMRTQSDTMREMMFQQQQENTKMLLEVLKTSRSEAPQQTSLVEMMNLLGVAQTISGGGKNSGSSAAEMLEMFFKGMELGKESGSENSNESLLQTAVKAFAPALSDLGKLVSDQNVSRGTQPPQNPQQQLPQMSRPTREVPRETMPPIATNTNEANAAEQQLEALKPYMQILLNAAALDADQETYADMLCDQIPEPMLREYLENPMNYQMLLGYFPSEAAPLFPWFDSLRETVLEFLAQQNDAGAGDAGQFDQNVSRGTGSALSSDGDTTA